MPKSLFRRLVRSRKGSVMVETALMITILLVLMFGIIDLGRALFTANNLTSAAREGARFAAVSDLPLDSAAIRTAVKSHFSPFGGPALTDANIKLLATGDPALRTWALRVTIRYRFTWITPIRALVGSMADSLHGQAEYHLENQ